MYILQNRNPKLIRAVLPPHPVQAKHRKKKKNHLFSGCACVCVCLCCSLLTAALHTRQLMHRCLWNKLQRHRQRWACCSAGISAGSWLRCASGMSAISAVSLRTAKKHTGFPFVCLQAEPPGRGVLFTCCLPAGFWIVLWLGSGLCACDAKCCVTVTHPRVARFCWDAAADRLHWCCSRSTMSAFNPAEAVL